MFERSNIQSRHFFLRHLRWPAVISLLALLLACATSPTGRSQFVGLAPSDAEMGKMGAVAYSDMKKKTKINTDPATNKYVACVAHALLNTFPGDEGQGWEITVFEDDTPNAFALPGKKIGVHTGIFKAAKNQSQLAAVIGHEIGHVEAHHGAERMSVNTAATGAALVGALLLGSGSSNDRDMAIAALGVGATVGVVLPFSRVQESEADTLGLRYMAQAGFDPAEAITLWQNMNKEGGAKPPEFLSTHPADETRMAALTRQQTDVDPLYQQAKAEGRRPSCT